MAIYEARGFSSYLYPYKGPLEPFDYIAQFRPLKPPEDIDIEEYKRTQANTSPLLPKWQGHSREKR
ncbi:hypothetical protein JavanS466_0014 [Streptococcus satellite phage Javan466]|nr:hypothetical protein JavanS466_0014 [Streptococcus satellite phage Javan466]